MYLRLKKTFHRLAEIDRKIDEKIFGPIVRRRFMGKHIADDGTICSSQEEMLQINRKIERVLLPEKIGQVFGFLHRIEVAEWHKANVAKRGLPVQTLEQKLRKYVEREVDVTQR